MKIKIIYPNWAVNPYNVGDTICTTSVVKAVLDRYPDAEVTYVSNEFACEMFANHPRVKTELPDNVLLYFADRDWREALRKGWRFADEDLIIMLYPEWQTDLWDYLGVPDNLDNMLDNPEANIITYNFCRMAGFEDFREQRPEIILSHEDRSVVNTIMLPGDKWVALNVAPKRQSQIKPDESQFRYDILLTAQVANKLREHGYKILEVGYKDYLGIGDTWLGHRPLRECCAIMEKCKLFIGNDGGMHNVANAVNMPVLLFQSYPYNPPELFTMGNGTVLDNGCPYNQSCDHWAKIKHVSDAKTGCDKMCENLSPESIVEKALEILR